MEHRPHQQIVRLAEQRLVGDDAEGVHDVVENAVGQDAAIGADRDDRPVPEHHYGDQGGAQVSDDPVGGLWSRGVTFSGQVRGVFRIAGVPSGRPKRRPRQDRPAHACAVGKSISAAPRHLPGSPHDSTPPPRHDSPSRRRPRRPQRPPLPHRVLGEAIWRHRAGLVRPGQRHDGRSGP